MNNPHLEFVIDMRDSWVEISGQVQTVPTQKYGKKNRKGIVWGVAQQWGLILWLPSPISHSIKSIQLISTSTPRKYVAWDISPSKDMCKHQTDMGNNSAYTLHS